MLKDNLTECCKPHEKLKSKSQENKEKPKVAMECCNTASYYKDNV